MKVTFDDAKAFEGAMQWVTPVAAADGAVLMSADRLARVTFRAEGDPGMRMASLEAHVTPSGGTDRPIPFSGPHLSQMSKALARKGAAGEVTMDIPDDGPAIIGNADLRFPVVRLTGPMSLNGDRERFSGIGDVDCDDFMGILKSAQSLTGSQSGAVSMVDLTFDPDTMRVSAMGTDKYVMGVFTSEFRPSDGYKSDCEERGKASSFLLVPSLGGLPKGDGTASISESPESVRIDFTGGRSATMRKQAPKPLPWRAVMERQRPEARRDGETAIGIDVRDLMTSASIVTMSSSGGDGIGRGIIILTAGHGRMTVRSGAPGSPTDAIASDYTGDDVTLRFNSDELGRMLRVIPPGKVRLMTYGDAPAFVTDGTMTVFINQSRG